MKKQIKQLSQKVRQLEQTGQPYENYIRQEYEVQGDVAQVHIDLYEGLEVYNPFSMGIQRALNPEIYTFIDEKIQYLPYAYSVKLCFHHKGISAREQQEIIGKLKEHYGVILHDKRIDLKLNAIKSGGLAVVGFAALSVYFLPIFSKVAEVLAELLSIVATFSLWEAVDFYWLERKQIRMEWLNAGQIAISQVEFIEK